MNICITLQERKVGGVGRARNRAGLEICRGPRRGILSKHPAVEHFS